MKFLFTIGLLAGWLTAFAQVPATTPPAATTVAKPAAPVKVLTPAEIRQKEKLAKVLAEERKYREEIAKAQREYQAKQAEKERQRREKEVQRQGKETTPTPAPVVGSEPEPSKPSTPSAPKPEKAAKAPRLPRPAKASAPPPDSGAVRSVKETERKKREQVVEAETPNARQTERDLIRQQKQNERDARKVERAKARILSPSPDESASDAASPEATSVPATEFLPKGHLFAPILLDPLEAQTYASVLPAFRTDGLNYRGTIVPFEFGFCKPFFRWTKAPGRASELTLDVASYTQFEVYYDDAKQTQKRQLINTDYKFSVIYNLLRNNHVWRFRFYHLSSHLGDDYLFRNAIQYYTPNSVNYELVDVTYSRTVNNTRLYGGVGVGLRKPEERKLLSAHAGFYYRSPKTTQLVRLVGGLDLKVWQQTDYRPGIKAAIGIEVGKAANPLTFVLEGYTGFRPYSEYENQHVRWLGIGFYFNPI